MISKAKLVLIVEDKAPLRKLITRVLVRQGYSVVEADGVNAAFEAFEQRSGQIDVLFSDINLEDGNGVELFRRLRKFSPSLSAVFSSGGGQIDLNLSENEQNSCCFLMKPFHMNELRAAIERVSPVVYQTLRQ